MDYMVNLKEENKNKALQLIFFSIKCVLEKLILTQIIYM